MQPLLTFACSDARFQALADIKHPAASSLDVALRISHASNDILRSLLTPELSLRYHDQLQITLTRDFNFSQAQLGLLKYRRNLLALEIQRSAPSPVDQKEPDTAEFIIDEGVGGFSPLSARKAVSKLQQLEPIEEESPSQSRKHASPPLNTITALADDGENDALAVKTKNPEQKITFVFHSPTPSPADPSASPTSLIRGPSPVSNSPKKRQRRATSTSSIPSPDERSSFQ